MSEHTPETIRALLDGITAGEWVAEAYDRDSDRGFWQGYIEVRIGAGRGQARIIEPSDADAAFIAASPGIARYALELAAENTRLRGIVLRYTAPNTWCAYHHAHPDRHGEDCLLTKCRDLRAALAGAGDARDA